MNRPPKSLIVGMTDGLQKVRERSKPRRTIQNLKFPTTLETDDYSELPRSRAPAATQFVAWRPLIKLAEFRGSLNQWNAPAAIISRFIGHVIAAGSSGCARASPTPATCAVTNATTASWQQKTLPKKKKPSPIPGLALRIKKPLSQRSRTNIQSRRRSVPRARCCIRNCFG